MEVGKLIAIGAMVIVFSLMLTVAFAPVISLAYFPTATPKPNPLELSSFDRKWYSIPDVDPPGLSQVDSTRPRIRQDPQTLDTSHFRVHYAIEGVDRVIDYNLDGNGHPDFVEVISASLEYAWYAEIDFFGWPTPPSDGELGGDGRVDVYLLDLPDDAGRLAYAEIDGIELGDNPNTPYVETKAGSGYIVIDVDTVPISTLATTAHELMHLIQFGMVGGESHGWLEEAMAVWMEEQVLGTRHLPSYIGVFLAPDACLTSPGSGKYHWYSLWVFIQFLSERYGTETVMELLRDVGLSESQAWDRLLKVQETDLDSLVRDFSVALLTRGFVKDFLYPTLTIEGSVRLGSTFIPDDGVEQMGADYVEIEARGPIQISLESQGLTGVVVGINDDLGYLYKMPEGQTSLDAGLFDHVYVIVMNPQMVFSPSDCQITEYSIDVSLGDDLRRADFSIAVDNFRPLRFAVPHD
ncbi:MAG: hypothetical protein WD751_04290 [Anaerolineales bacterium]